MPTEPVRTPHRATSASRLAAAIVVVASGIAGCAPPPAAVPEPVAEEDLPELRDALRADPEDRDLQGHLAASLLEAGRCDEASRIAGDAVASPFDSWPTLVQGRCLEEAGRDSEALEVYGEYLTTYDQGDGAAPVRGRALLAERRLAESRARGVLRNPPGTAGPATTVAVLPFRVRGDDALEPVGRSFSDRLSVDLAELEGLAVVDPVLVRLVTDRFEAPGAFGYDSAQAVALGRALGAGQVIQGTAYLDGESLNRLGTLITRADGSERQGGLVEGPLGDLPRLEKELALATAGVLGETPSPEERTRILYRGPRDLAALRAYGEGLDLQAREAYAEAVPRFAETVRLDPDFEDGRRALEANAAAALLVQEDGGNVLAATPTVAAAIESALRPGGPVDPLRRAIRAGTSDVSATQGERITGITAATGEDGAVGSIQNLDAPALLTPAQLTGLIRILVVIPGG